jgi:hypothetical protein
MTDYLIIREMGRVGGEASNPSHLSSLRKPIVIVRNLTYLLFCKERDRSHVTKQSLISGCYWCEESILFIYQAFNNHFLLGVPFTTFRLGD